MNNIATKHTLVRCSMALFLLLGWHQAQSCEISQDESGRTIFKDCFKRDDPPTLKMPNLQIKSASIFASPGGPDLFFSFEIINSGQVDSDRVLFYPGYYINGRNSGFNIESTFYVVSEDNSFNYVYDYSLSQWMPFSKTKHRLNNLAAGDTKLYRSQGQYSLWGRDMTYKVGLSIEVDKPQSSYIRSLAHGEIVESNEFDNSSSIECLVYGNNLSELSELLPIKHFHINNDLNLPLINPC